MKRNTIITILILMLTANISFADFSYVDTSDFTGDAFFTPPALKNKHEKEQSLNADTGEQRTLPPIKRARIILKNKSYERNLKNNQMAPTDPEGGIFRNDTETSDFVSKEIEENFDENMMPDGFEADEESVKERKKSRLFRSKKNSEEKAFNLENTENIVLDCENMDYDTEKYCLYATGNVNVEFVKQGTIIKADKITYDRMNNTIKAEGNVRILKNDQTITGDYIFVDMNEENALIENPLTRTSTIEIKAQKGYVYGNRIVQENGSIVVNESFPVNLRSTSSGPQMSRMLVPKDQTLTSDMEKGIVKVQAKDLKIIQKGEHEILAIKRATIYKGKYKILKIPALKIYTNQNHDYAETNSWEIGSERGLGMYIGPGFVFRLPKGSVLKAIPMLNYDHRIGIGAVGRFQSGTNRTQAAYGTAGSKILVHGKQRLDDDVYLLYGVNDYIDEWFLGRRRPKYGVGLVYEKAFESTNFLLKDRRSAYTHRFDLGYYHDIDEDRHYSRLYGPQIGTFRARYMAQADQNLFLRRNVDKQKEFSVDVTAQLASSVYGTGDTQMIGRIGPRLHTQYKRWMQDIGYFQSVYSDDTPLSVFDSYRYGKSNLYFREYFRICRYLTVSWFGSVNLSGDSPNDQLFQENAFYLSFGPDDVKFNLGYDTVRENLFFTVEMMMNARGTKIDYERLEIKQDKKAEKDTLVDKSASDKSNFRNSEKAPVLQRAVVEDIKQVEDVL